LKNLSNFRRIRSEAPGFSTLKDRQGFQAAMEKLAPPKKK